MEQEILQPIDAYFSMYRDKHRELTEQYFDELVRQSGVSAEDNAALVAARNKALEKYNTASASVRKYKGLRAFLSVLTALFLFAGLITCIALWNDIQRWVGILTAVLAVAVSAALIAVICTVFNRRIRDGSGVADRYKAEADELETKAWRQMAPLNAKYDWNIPDELIHRTVPQICPDKYFDEEKLEYFDRHCSLSAYDENSSALFVRSGNCDGRPFLITRFLRQSMRSRMYTGSLLISWTEWETDSKGMSRAVHHSQTLTATVSKPEPVYRPVTYLFYGCDAASDLHFDRCPTVPKDADDKKIDSIVKKGEKELEKKSRESVSKGGSFNKLANSEFEVLFGAYNRDNEMQFRLMFTPLAQQNTVKLLRSKEPYGDDFYFHKNGAVNVICSEHSAQLDLSADPRHFADFDLDKARRNFLRFNCEYFRSVYFDFAPLFCIPLYTQDAPRERFGVCEHIGNIGEWEAEAVANYFDDRELAPPNNATRIIVKATTTVGEHGCVAHVTAHGFEAIPQVDEVPVFGGDGHTHLVPVPWTLYSPVEQTTDIDMQSMDISREQFNSDNREDAIFIAGIKAKIQR